MAEKEQEKAEGGWLVRAVAALLPSASAIVVAYVTLEVLTREVERVVRNDAIHSDLIQRHTAELAVLNERMVANIEQLKEMVRGQTARLSRMEDELRDHRVHREVTRR